ncbi:hypothetical protein GP486_006978 [Trichoglossum hirsutum]|uniref:Rho guanyl nucleotide exchange factor n=1 Tax=Trichoglossum hirsutum TaxID=265104 RepID=A0A9P8L742_9PEZI|nr:hypothetical protein GP486_006978 [Trichoglossum hirsutum]
MTRYSSTSSQGEPPTNPLPSPPLHSPVRTSTAGDYPQGRTLPRPPVDESDEEYIDGLVGNGGRAGSADEMARESIWKEVEAAIDSVGPGAPSARLNSRVEITHHSPIDEENEPAPLFSHNRVHSSSTHNDGTNGHLSATGTGNYINYGAYSDESDAEAAAGLEAMRMAEEQDAADDARRQSGESASTATHDQSSQAPRRAGDEPSSDSDYGNVDMGLYGGGYGASISYGGDSYTQPGAQWHSSEVEDTRRPLPTPGSTRRTGGTSTGAHSDADSNMYDYSIPDQDTIHPFPSFNSNARVDTFGTGGLSEPSPHRRRMSFDEGDEIHWDPQAPGQRSGSQSPQKNREAEEFPELFYHPAPSSTGTQRPLPSVPRTAANQAPQLMAAGTYRGDAQYQQPYDLPSQVGRSSYSTTTSDSPNNRTLLTPPPQVPRSSSLSSHPSTPQTIPPVRSKTDAEERRLRLMKQQVGTRSDLPDSETGYDSPPVPQSAMTLDLPAIPLGKRKRFTPAKLSTADFKKCEEPWALSSIARWVKDMSEGETDLKKGVVVDGIVALFTHKVPTMNTADAETLGERVVKDMLDAGALVEEEEWVKIRDVHMSGVIWQLTGLGCYAPRLHSTDMPGRCYSPHCSRTLKKISLQVSEPQRTQEDWQTFYKVKKEDIEGVHKKEIHRQNILHEIVQTEETYLGDLRILMVLYRDQLRNWEPPIINPKRIDGFVKDVFGKADAVKKANEDFLLAQLKYRQQEQGPWIVGFSDIFREWIRKAKKAYVEYAASFPTATMLVRKEAEKNLLFRQFLDQARDNELSRRLDWNTFLKAPITRLQHYSLLLFTVYKDMLQETEEKTNLNTAIEEIKVVTHECDARVDEVTKKVALTELGSKLMLRPGMDGVELNLEHLGRELVFRGDLQRTGGNRFTWLETHAILFDHYLVLAKTIQRGDGSGGAYDVSKLPIPMDLLVLESTNDDPVVKSTVRGLGPVRPAPTANSQTQSLPSNLNHAATTTSLSSVNSSNSGKTIVTSTVIESPKDEKIMYPFRIKHLGKSEVYTLYASSAQNRQDWCDKILEAKTRHAASLFRQNAEPFRLRAIADTAFGSETHASGAKSIIIKGTPLDRSIREVEKMFEKSGPRPGIVCRAAVNCATAFHQPYGRQMVAIGTDYGVYISDIKNPRGWVRAIQASKVSQIAVLEEFSIFLVLSDKALSAYHLDIVCPVSGVPQPNDSARRAPQKLSGTRDVGFFATGRMKDRALVFYKKRDGISSTFKACSPKVIQYRQIYVLEPVFQKATEKKSRFFRRGDTEFFREYDDFYIPTECFGINLFQSSLAISTARGFEVLTLDKKQSWSVPDLKQPHVVTISSRLSGQKPLGMFRLSDTEFLLCYEECAVYVNKHGDVSRSVIMEFVGKAKSAAMYGPYIILFDSDFVEVRNAQNGRLRQVIAGRDVRCLDDAQSGGSAVARTVKVALQHPESDGRQLVVELLLNEGQTD